MRLLSTVWSSRPPDFSDGVVVLRRDQVSRRQILRRVWACDHGDAVLLNGALGFDERWWDLWLALAVRLRGKRVGVVVSDATWHARSERAHARVPLLQPASELLGKALLRLACGSRTHVCFLSPEEVADFCERTGLPRARAHFTPFHASLLADEEVRLRDLREHARKDYVFSGGDSRRDYGLLVEALAGSCHRVRVATRARCRWPESFEAGAVSHDRFMDLLAGSAVVVLPLLASTTRSVGQQTYLNAMLLGVPVVVSDAPGVRAHLQDGVHARIVPCGDAGALRRAVDWVLDPENGEHVHAMVQEGRRRARELGPDAYFRHLKALGAGLLEA